MGLFENWPYTNFHDLNNSWILKTVKALASEVEKLKVDLSDLNLQKYVNNYLQQLVDNGTLSLPSFYNQYNTSAYLEASTEQIGQVSLPVDHVVCSAEFNNGYLYVAHHENDASMMYISKYSFPDLALITREQIASQMHGNGLGYDAVRDVLILSNGINADLANASTLYLIDPGDLSVVKRINYNPFGYASLSTFDVSPDGTSAAALVTGSNKVLEYDINENTGVASIVRIHNIQDIGDGIRQDGTLTNTFYYQLMSNNSLPEYSNNQVVLYSFRTGAFKTLYLSKSDYDELEGISRIRWSTYVGLILVDINGKVYFADTSNKIIASGLLTKSDAVCAGTPQYMLTNPQQLHTLTGTEEFTVTESGIDMTCMKSCYSFDLQNYSLRSLECMQDAWQFHAGWYYAPLRFGDRYFLTGVLTTIRGGTLMVRYGYHHSDGKLYLQRIAYTASDGTYTNGLYDPAVDDTTAVEAAVTAFLAENYNEMQSSVYLYPEIYNVSEYTRTGDIWHIELA